MLIYYFADFEGKSESIKINILVSFMRPANCS